MISSEIFIIKRDGKKEAFSLDKIKNAISKAFLSVGSFATQDVITNVLSRVSISDGTNVEEIQNQVEVALMAEHYYSVAKAYMLYRQNIWKTVKSETNLNSSWIIAMLPTLPAVASTMPTPMWKIRISPH